MKRFVSVSAIVALLLALFVAVNSSTSSVAQTGDQATIEAQETRIAELEATVAARGQRLNAQRTEIADLRTQVAGGPVATEELPPEDAPAAGDVTTSLFGVVPESLPQGEDGLLSFVAMGPAIENYLPVVLRNNTGGEVFISGVEGVARDANGTLLGSVGLAYLAPYHVMPGEIAVGYIYFDGVDELPADASYELEPDFSAIEGDFAFQADMVITEAEFSSDGIVGIAMNPLQQEMSGGSVVGLCFDANGSIAGYFTGSTDKFDIPAGDDTPFGAYFYTPEDGFGARPDATVCPAYLIGVVGTAF